MAWRRVLVTNQYWEPLRLIAYQLRLHGVMAVVEGLAIAGVSRAWP